jgi:rhodanese-related sulfurtransferase
MDRLLEFITANPLLVAAILLMAIAVVAVEIQLRARALLEVSTAEAVRMINRGATVVDIRDQARFDAGHIVEAVHMAPADLSKGEEGRIKKKRGVLVICENGSQSYRAVKALRAAGFDGAFSLKGGIGSWQRDGQPLVTGKR